MAAPPPIRLMVSHRKAGVTTYVQTFFQVAEPNMDCWIANSQLYQHEHDFPGIDTCECGKEKFKMSERCIECEYRRLTEAAEEYFR